MKDPREPRRIPRSQQKAHTRSLLVFPAGWLNLVGHPAGAKYVVVGNQAGLMKLATVGPPGSNTPLTELGVFLDLTSRVLFHGERGLLSFAFHPNFLKNGRFFVSYICDGSVHKDCQVRRAGGR